MPWYIWLLGFAIVGNYAYWIIRDIIKDKKKGP